MSLPPDHIWQRVHSYHVDSGCGESITGWREEARGLGWWLQHGENHEASKFFPDSFYMQPGPLEQLEEMRVADTVDWLSSIHEYQKHDD